MKKEIGPVVYREWALGIAYQSEGSEYIDFAPLKICLTHPEVSHMSPLGGSVMFHPDEVRPATREDFDRIGVVWHDEYGSDESGQPARVEDEPARLCRRCVAAAAAAASCDPSAIAEAASLPFDLP